VEDRRREAHCVENGPAADGERVGVAIDRALQQGREQGLHDGRIVLGDLASGDGHHVSDDLHRLPVRCGVAADHRLKARIGGPNAVIHEDGGPMPFVGLATTKDIGDKGALRIERVAREDDRALVGHRETLDVLLSPGPDERAVKQIAFP
jgi:hypothetical protein